MNELNEIQIIVPDLPTPQEWSAVEADVEPEEIPVLRLQKLYAGILEEARPPDELDRVNLLGWLMLWTRLFQGLEGLRGAAVRRSLHSARILSRSLLETNLHLRAIARQYLNTSSPWPASLRLQTVEQRLQAYVAWSIAQDWREWKHFLRPSNLRAVYDPEPARSYARQYGDVVAAAGDLLEEYETLTDAEAREEREEAERVGRNRMEEYERWLSDERLAPHWERLRREKHHTLFSFLNPDENSAFKAFEADGVPYGYSSYARGSSAVHGTTIEGILMRRGPTFAPQVWSSEEEIASALDRGIGSARNALLGLYIIRPRNLPADQATDS